MIGANMYEALRPLRYKRVAARMCRGYRGITYSLCVTMAIRLVKRCDHRSLGNSVDCLATAEQQLKRYMERIAGRG